MKAAKLIEEYQAKVIECDGDIERATAGRNEATGEWDFNIHGEALKVAETRRQAYFQFIKDLEDIDD